MRTRQREYDNCQGNWIAYAGLFKFPEGDAGARRVLGISRTLAGCGLNVLVLPGGNPVCALTSLDERISYQGINEYSSDWPVRRKLHAIMWNAGIRTIQSLNRQPTQPRAVIVYGASTPLLRRLLGWCSQRSIPLICDVVEWYKGSHMLGGHLGPMHLSNIYCMRRLVKHSQGVIGISKLLCDYYRSSGLPVLCIPPTLKVSEVPCRFGQCGLRNRIHLIYAGTPGKKDLLANALAAMELVDPSGSRFHLQIFGPTENQVRELWPNYSDKTVEVCGPHTHEQTLHATKRADYSILLRPDERYANAGFPTKVVESLSCGTPVICNLTSDLGNFIHNRVEGIICSDHSAAAFAEALRIVTAIDIKLVHQMRRASRRQAERSFDSSRYVSRMRRFIRKIGASV